VVAVVVDERAHAASTEERAMRKDLIRIGASEAAAPLGLSEWVSPTRYYAEKLGLVERDGDSEAAFLGRHVEHSVASAFAEKHDVRLSPWASVRSVARPWLGATPDRVIFPDDMSEAFRRTFDVERDEIVLLEVKTTGLASYQPPRKIDLKWGAPHTSDIPAGYLVQAHVQAIVMAESVEPLGLDVRKVIVPALLPGRGVVDFVVRVDWDMARNIVANLARFVDVHLVPEVPPPAEDEDDWRIFGDSLRVPMARKEKIHADVGTPLHDLLIRYRGYAHAEEVAKLGKAQARAALIDAIGDGYGVEADNIGSVILTSPKEVTTPKIAKAAFADSVLAEVKEHDGELADRIRALAAAHTHARPTGRVLRPYFKELT